MRTDLLRARVDDHVRGLGEGSDDLLSVRVVSSLVALLADKMQLYEMDYIDNAGIQSACNVKQPFLFELRPVFSEFFYRQQPKIYLEQMGMLDVHLKDTDDYWRGGGA